MTFIEELFGTTSLPCPEEELRKKILSDNLVTLRAQELMISQFASEAIRQMHPVERQALIKRISPPPKPLHQVGWKVESGLQSGKPRIVGYCGRCGQDCHYDGKPSSAKDVVWAHCTLGPSKFPVAIIEEYSGKFGYTS